MKQSLLTSVFLFLTIALALVVFTRWLHPAVFPLGIQYSLAALSILAGMFLVLCHEN